MKTRTTNFKTLKNKLAKKNTITKAAKKHIKGGIGSHDIADI